MSISLTRTQQEVVDHADGRLAGSRRSWFGENAGAYGACPAAACSSR